MKKILNRLNVALNIVIWIIIIVLGELYYGMILLVELVLSYIIQLFYYIGKKLIQKLSWK